MGTVTKGKIFRSDLEQFDGTLSKSRINSSGGSEAGLSVNDYVDVLQVFGGGDTDNMTNATISTAISSLGSANIGLLFATGTWTISNSLSIPSNFTVIVPAGCIFSVASGQTLTVAGVFERQHGTFSSGSGTVTISGTDVLATGSTSSHFAVDTGNADVYVIDPADNPSGYVAGQMFSFKAKNSNTGASTLNVESLGAKNIKKYDSDGTLDALEAGDIIEDQIVRVTYDGTQFQLVPNIQLSGSIVTTTTDNVYTKTETWKQGSDVASATSLPIDVDGNFFDVTGTATVTSFATKGIGTFVVLQFDGACTLTHHVDDLILPSGANITTAAGDIGIFYEYASGDWRCISYTGKNAVFSSVTAGKLNATGDTSAGDDAAIGFTSTEGLILTGQGSTNDITIKNDADTVVAKVATGTTVLDLTTALAIADGGTGATTAAAAATALGQPTYAKADLASATNKTIPTTGNYFDVTGTTTIVTMAVAANRHFFLQFDAALTLTHDGTDISLPADASITTAAGDVAEFYSIATNDVVCLNYSKADGTAVVASAGGGPSVGTNGIIRTNAANIQEDITLSDHSATFTTTHGSNLIANRGSNDDFVDGDMVMVSNSGGALPSGYVAGTQYFVRDITSTTMKLSTSFGGSVQAISGNGSGTHTIYQNINGMSAGPITISEDTVTIPAGSTWNII